MSLQTPMRTCPTCGHPDTNRRDFCERCGEYLRWEDTGEHAPVTTPTAEWRGPAAATGRSSTPPEVAAPPEPVLLLLQGETTVRVAAGGRATLAGILRNQSGVVDNYDFRVTGVPAGWVTPPPTAYLLPFGSGEGHEQAFELALEPPRAPEAEARAWPLTIEVSSRTSGRVAARASATLIVEPYEELAVRARPQRRRGRFGATFTIDVTNRGNAEAVVPLRAADGDDACDARLDPPAVRVAPGAHASARLRVSPRRTLWLGRPVEHRIDVDGPLPQQVALRQLPWIPWWVPPLVLALVAIAIALLALRGERIVVPEVRGQTVEQAQALLVEAGLESAPRLQEQVVADPRQVGRVIAQTPAAGDEIGSDDAIILRSAVANQVVAVPDLRGATREQAQQALAAAGLALGTIEPPDAPPDATVGFQNPGAGGQARVGSPVNVTLEAAEEQEDEQEPSEPPPPEQRPAEEPPPVEPVPAQQ